MPLRDRTLSLTPPRLLDEEQAHLDALDADGVVDQVLGVLGDRAGPLDVVAGDGGIGDPPGRVGPEARQGLAQQLQPAEGAPLEQEPVDLVDLGPRIDQLGRGPERLRLRVGVAEPAGVHGDGRQQPGGDLARERAPQRVDGPGHQRPGRLGGGVLQENGPEVVLADVVIDHHPGAFEVADPARHVPELAPGREVEDHDHLAIGQVRRVDVRAEVLEQGAAGVEVIVPRRGPARVDDADVLPLLAEEPRHADLRAECVAVGTDVRGHQEAVVQGDQVGQRSPVDAHGGGPRQVTSVSPHLTAWRFDAATPPPAGVVRQPLSAERYPDPGGSLPGKIC